MQNIKLIRNNIELAINSIPLVVDVPKIRSKKLFFKISELIKVILSKVVYILLSTEPNICSNIKFLEDIIVCVTLLFSKIPPN